MTTEAVFVMVVIYTLNTWDSHCPPMRHLKKTQLRAPVSIILMTPMVMGTMIIGEEKKGEEEEGARHHQTQRERVPRNTDDSKLTNHNARSMVNFKTAV